MNKNLWQKGFPKSGIQKEEIHVWRWPLSLTDSQKEDYRSILLPNELERAGKFYFKKDRNRFIASQGTLKRILGLYLNEDPKRIQFEYTAFGKPGLKSVSTFQKFSFNLSHSENLALLAITNQGNIGIDVEYLRYDVDVESIVSRFFSLAEKHLIRKLVGKKQNDLFFQFWTRKEAFLKGIGKGLSLPMEYCDVSSVDENNFSPVIFSSDMKDHSGWYILDLEPGKEYVGAIAVEKPEMNISFWDFRFSG